MTSSDLLDHHLLRVLLFPRLELFAASAWFGPLLVSSLCPNASPPVTACPVITPFHIASAYTTILSFKFYFASCFSSLFWSTDFTQAGGFTPVPLAVVPLASRTMSRQQCEWSQVLAEWLLYAHTRNLGIIAMTGDCCMSFSPLPLRTLCHPRCCQSGYILG